MEFGLSSPSMDSSMRRQMQMQMQMQAFNPDSGMSVEVDYASGLLDSTWDPQHLADPFNRPAVSPVRSVVLTPEKETEYAQVLAAAKARAKQLDAAAAAAAAAAERSRR